MTTGDPFTRSGGSAAGAGSGSSGWYDLFSRGARDWLRHNEKIREAVRANLPEIIANSDVAGPGGQVVRVPVKMLEHYHFRLRSQERQEGVGQGAGKPGDQLVPPGRDRGPGQRGAGGRDDGGVEFVLEFKVDDIVDWLWEEMQLPNLRARVGRAEETDWVREGWDKRGARSRLDRRRSLRESVKRRAVQGDSPPFTDEDLRFRQLRKREQPTTQAVVFLLMDVSGSMGEPERRLAKSFFFWAVQGLRRQYLHLDTVFVAHTTEAWEFDEEQFFQVSGTGGTIASTGFTKVRELIEERWSPQRYNVYLFYASDGDNSSSDRALAETELDRVCPLVNYAGYVEVAPGGHSRYASETRALFSTLVAGGQPVGYFTVTGLDDVWSAVRHFFGHEARAQGESA
jgi:uncharacterized sporulation protein YeaH/YhbH (DUF444 family)